MNQSSPADPPAVAARPKRALRADWFTFAILAVAIIGSLLPAQGAAIPTIDVGSKIAIALLFYLYGVRLEPKQTIAGLKHWRLHATILSCTYVIFPIIGLALGALVPWFISPEIYRGVLFLSLLPSTVQSSINFTSIARGNIAGAIVSASISNLLGVIITPLLAIWLMSTTGLHLQASSILDIGGQILLPFVLGQLTRRWTAEWVLAHPKLKYFDQASVLLVVYKAFSQGVRDGIWQRTGVVEILQILLLSAVVLTIMLALTWWMAKWFKFNRADQIAIQFCGTKKSLVTGVPMAGVMFAGADIGLIVLPLMIFHQLQLMVCGSLAGHYAQKDDSWHQAGEEAAESAVNEGPSQTAK